MIAALYVESGPGGYAGIPDVDPWDIVRDARKYEGSDPVVCHPPCQRWGKFWHGSTRNPHQFKMGDDGGCFKAALATVRRVGGVIEHPAGSHAYDKEFFNLRKPPTEGGWVGPDEFGGYTCRVEQGMYGHFSNKATWLYAVPKGAELPELRWGKGGQKLHPAAVAKYGYEKARRIGMIAMVGGKDKVKIRNSIPREFQNVLLGIARSVKNQELVQ
jgi:hypothetical protein